MKRTELILSRGDQSQTVIADKLGITQDCLSKIELGQRNPSILLAAKICRLYKEPPEKLFPDIFLLQDTTKKSIK
mgnify:FL=1